MNSQIAQTIAQQLGSQAFAMMGARGYRTREAGLELEIKGAKKAKRITIDLAADDTYTVTFYIVTRNFNVKATAFEGVYVDSLHHTIESFTGLYLSL